ncbi:Starch-binding associating with outer membrane [Pedobacter steynii]|uniref:Starch-binding associating with outer membrane n=1 Tax=Pedobacter steynii TaxID=430522 RepID=A0A1G9JPU0_9SPHI|nr:RagB/SusD family nutrient uptake outer membrane protein [Pedobacter steynii]NQX38310.1 RagB/SusD family nutrient uptake outer membrane protein [Pedobacter steynii]SDL39154.1 Starch-binding associating with outer membrane [Pedobacter steynii]
MKHTYLNIGKIVLVGLISITPFFSCKKAVETSPYSSFASANFFQSVNEAYAATLGIYETMKSPNTYAWYIPLVYDADTDVEFLSPGNTVNDFREVSHYYYLAGNSYFYGTWSTLYNGIDRANIVIERIGKMDLYTGGTPAQKADLNRMLGEAKFLRGFYYSELIRLWGDVPFKTKSTAAGDEMRLPLTDRYIIYNQVIKDMQEAVEVLPQTLANDERINKFGAKAMLARIALFAGGYSLRSDGTMKQEADYKKYYQIAQTQVNDVISSGLYQLNPSYSQVFKNQSQQVFEPKESLFEASFYTPAVTTTSNSSIGTFNAPLTANGLYGSTLNRTFVPASFYTSFQDGDLRRDFSVARYSLDVNGNRVPLLTARQDEQWTPGKWSREYQKNSALEKSYTNINYVAMRYADVLLMKAEIENELNGGPTAAAYDAINAVRRRAFGTTTAGSGISIALGAGGTGYTAATTISITGTGTDAYAVPTIVSGKITAITILNAGGGYIAAPTVVINGPGTGATATATLLPKKNNQDVDLPSGLGQDAFLKSIQNERAWELCFEGMRRADLIRWNLLGDKIKATQDAVKAIRALYGYEANTNFVKGKHELYPIPQNEIDVNKNITRQNPGF